MNRKSIMSCLFLIPFIYVADVPADDGATCGGIAEINSKRIFSEKGITGERPGYGKLVTGVRSARVREAPSFDAPVEYGLKEGDIVSVIKTEGEWNYIQREDGKKGWGHKSIFLTSGQSENIGIDKKEEDPVIVQRPEFYENETETKDEIKEDYKTFDEKIPYPDTNMVSADNETSGSGIPIHWVDNDMLNLNFLDVDIREVLTAIALDREINIVASKDVSGKITVHLYNMTLDQALGAITLAGGFSFIKKDNLYYVFKPGENKDPLAEKLQMKIFKLRYAAADKVQEILSALPGTRTIKIHEPTKTIIAEDTPENLKKIEEIIDQWDQMPKQVLIEAKILEVALTDDMSLGVNWSTILGDVRVGTGNFSTSTMGSTGPVSPVPDSGEGIFANIITAAGTDHQFAAALDALQSKTRVNTLSTPKILAIHGKPAKVQVGGQQGYSVTTTNEGVSTETIEFIDTGTILEITPFIDDEDNILLDVQPSIKSARIEEGIPVVNSTEVSTWLNAKNGETVFIGGLIQDTKTRTREMVPCLGGIPGVGTLFGKTTRGTGKSELVVLITPNIIKTGDNDKDNSIIEKAEKIENELKREPLPAGEQAFEFMSPFK